MKFSVFYIAAGCLLGTGIITISVEAPGFGWLFILAVLCLIVDAVFKACNPGGK